MKPFLFCLIALGSALSLRAQNQVNYWISDYATGLDFTGGNPVPFARPTTAIFCRTSASVSDSAGNLLFFTNGYNVYNRNSVAMPNGAQLDIGDYVNWGYGMLNGDGACIIPVPGQNGKYYVFHVDLSNTDLPEGNAVLFPHHLFYCVVDMSLDGGNGAVVAGQRDVVVLTDTLTAMGMKAVKHGNGRDWWLLCHEYGSNRYYRFLIDAAGVHGPYSQFSGITYRWYNAMTFSPMKFSEDGQQFAQLSYDSNCVELYDFDRCTGILSNYRRIGITTVDTAHDGGLSFSPSGRFLYVTHLSNEILQFDLTGSNISSTRTVVGTDDGILDPFPANYYYQGLAPNGKIYIVSYGSDYSMHVINYPDSLGLACDFVRRGLAVDSPLTWFATIPNVPNYALGRLLGSGCDTLTGVSEVSSSFACSVYPNPFSNQLNLTVTSARTDVEIIVYDVMGRSVYRNVFTPSNQIVKKSFDLSGFSPGIYALIVNVNNRRCTQKLVKQN